MKIFCIIQCSNLGGMEKVTLESVSLLKEAGHSVELFSLQPVGALRSLAAERAIPLNGTRQYKWMGLGNIPEIRRRINEVQPDRIWLIGHNYGSLIAAKLTKCPAFLSIHFHHSDRSMFFWKLFYSLAKKSTNRIHFVSRYIFEEVAELFGENDQVICFPNVFRKPENLISPRQARKSLGIPEDAFVIGNAGWLIPRKAFDVFLDTAAFIVKQIPEAVFVIAGDGSERERLEQQAEQLGIRKSVRFLGWQEDLALFYSSLDVLLFNSNFDCLPTTPLEAMACGLPVVCSLLHGGLREILRHEHDGFLINRHDPQLLADEVLKLYRDSEYRERFARSGQTRVLDLGSPEKHLACLNQFLGLT